MASLNPSTIRRSRQHYPILWMRKPRPREVKLHAQGHTARNQVQIGTQVCEKSNVAPATPQELFPSLEASASCSSNMARARAPGLGQEPLSNQGAIYPPGTRQESGTGAPLGPAGSSPDSGGQGAEREGAQGPVGRVSWREGAQEPVGRVRGAAGAGARAPRAAGDQGSAAALAPRRPLPAPAPSVVARSSVSPAPDQKAAAASRALRAPRNRPAGPVCFLSPASALKGRNAATNPLALEASGVPARSGAPAQLMVSVFQGSGIS